MIEGCSQDDPHQRTITLTEGSVFEVGRASRSETRPAKATRENLWLNSPVVSRSHAELLLRFEPVGNPSAPNLDAVRSTYSRYHHMLEKFALSSFNCSLDRERSIDIQSRIHKSVSWTSKRPCMEPK
ncbi:hypothetical protein P152DRAFT_149530 [Eremomyces bilateralis CBS 781.70]|uniref:FHA domain-containing protein n=1 Tax=Eremomyces bilateralis CBS 781.70 TaxID=1392243 RepID=A0A6G1FVN7_9PEZI|nr:uncharacterized protein P152DRAFT_149530 [Eremomyces bilateralis CBS 781.70]KAF1809778.1 hypothetical protein P152DRAFT_149530 [Eremomyces bilateralis CBS 781.70]